VNIPVVEGSKTAVALSAKAIQTSEW
jgi:hypothetical protein